MLGGLLVINLLSILLFPWRMIQSIPTVSGVGYFLYNNSHVTVSHNLKHVVFFFGVFSYWMIFEMFCSSIKIVYSVRGFFKIFDNFEIGVGPWSIFEILFSIFLFPNTENVFNCLSYNLQNRISCLLRFPLFTFEHIILKLLSITTKLIFFSIRLAFLLQRKPKLLRHK